MIQNIKFENYHAFYWELAKNSSHSRKNYCFILRATANNPAIPNKCELELMFL